MYILIIILVFLFIFYYKKNRVEGLDNYLNNSKVNLPINSENYVIDDRFLKFGQIDRPYIVPCNNYKLVRYPNGHLDYIEENKNWDNKCNECVSTPYKLFLNEEDGRITYVQKMNELII